MPPTTPTQIRDALRNAAATPPTSRALDEARKSFGSARPRPSSASRGRSNGDQHSAAVNSGRDAFGGATSPTTALSALAIQCSLLEQEMDAWGADVTAAAAWDAAANRAPSALFVCGAAGPSAEYINGLFDREPAGGRKGGEAPSYRRRRGARARWRGLRAAVKAKAGLAAVVSHATESRRGSTGVPGGVGGVWLFLAGDGRWYVHDELAKAARRPTGWACTRKALPPAGSSGPFGGALLPHEAPGGWQIAVGSNTFLPQPAVMLRAMTPAEADKLAAAKGKRWDAAAEAAPEAYEVTGAEGPNAEGCINGVFRRVDAARKEGGAPAFRRDGAAGAAPVWLYLATSNTWFISTEANKDTRKDAGWAHTGGVLPGTLPHGAAGAWKVCIDGEFKEQGGLVLEPLSGADADRRLAAAADAWAAAAERCSDSVRVAGVTGPCGGVCNGTYGHCGL